VSAPNGGYCLIAAAPPVWLLCVQSEEPAAQDDPEPIDNGSCYRSHAFRDALGDITHRRTRPYRPQTNGKVERFHRTLADEWAYARLYRSDAERCAEFSIWLHTYNHHRGHTALGGQPPATRVPNLSGQYS
jgi:transposase InsO family protein